MITSKGLIFFTDLQRWFLWKCGIHSTKNNIATAACLADQEFDKTASGEMRFGRAHTHLHILFSGIAHGRSKISR